MKENFLMRVLFCKIHCPFICFSKHSATQIYTPGPLKLENTTPDDPVTPIPIPILISNDSSDQSDDSERSSPEVREEVVSENQETVDVIILKSCIKKTDNIVVVDDDNDDAKEIVKKKVKWIDSVGEELVEIKEFESSDTGDTDSEEGGSCVCTIL